MSANDTAKMKKDIRLVIVLLAIGLALFGLRCYLVPQLENKIAEAADAAKMDSQVSTITNEYSSLNYQVESYGKQFVNLAANEETYIDHLGTLCDANKLEIAKMTVGDIVPCEQQNVDAMQIDLEVNGDLYHINSFISDLSNSGMLCRIQTVSYRVDKTTFPWMWRTIDDEIAIPWWDTTGVDAYLLEDPDDANTDDPDVLDVNAFMKQGTAVCYLEINFLGTEG